MPVGDPQTTGIRCMLMRGGTSKGAYFLADDLPSDPGARDELLLRVMGSPDARQIDGLGGAHPLTSKVAIVSATNRPDADIDYLFLQIGVDEPTVTDLQTCGNLLAGVAPFAIERGLVTASDALTSVKIRLVNTGDIATAVFETPGGLIDYEGTASIDGVPGTARPLELQVGSPPGRALLPTGNTSDDVAGHRVTLINNGMAVVLMSASEFGISGTPTPDELESNRALADEVERVRLATGPLFGIQDVATQTVPKMFLLSPPQNGGAISARAFIPTRVHSSIGVLMAASVAAGTAIPGTVAHDIAQQPDGDTVDIEHPSGTFPARVRVGRDSGGQWWASSTSTRTARKIFDGVVFPRPRL
jgi:4-oxalomesaconate tautomerase